MAGLYAAYQPASRLSLALFSSAAGRTAFLASSAGAASFLPFAALAHAAPEPFADANTSSFQPFPEPAATGPCLLIDAASAAEPAAAAAGDTPSYLQELWTVSKSILSVLRWRNVLAVLAKNLALQVLLTFNKYMLQLLEHEKQALEAEEQGQPVPDPPPIPDFKPSFTQGARQAFRELLVSMVRKTYEAGAMKRLGSTRSVPFLRDYKHWIRDVLAFKHRLDPVSTRFIKYLFAILHGTALHYAADLTVSVADLFRTHWGRKYRRSSHLAEVLIRGTVGQVAQAFFRFLGASMGGALTALLNPAPGVITAGTLAGDIVALTLSAPLIAWLTGPPLPPLPEEEEDFKEG